MRSTFLVASLLVLAGCSYQGASSQLPASAVTQVAAERVGFVVPVPLSVLRGFGKGIVVRTSGRKRADGTGVPPWLKVSVETQVIGPTEPVVGDMVTAIPVDIDIAPIGLQIRGVRLELNPFNEEISRRGTDEKLPDSWRLDLEPVTNRAFFDAKPQGNRVTEYPFDVVVLYPATPAARLLDSRLVARDVLPPNVRPETVSVALDLEGDGSADLLIVETCGGDWSKPGGDDNCENTTGFVYERVGASWRIIDVLGC